MFETKIKVRFSDTDRAGILFFAKVFDYAHSSFEDLIISFDLPFEYFASDDYAFPLTKTTSDFHFPIMFGDELLIELSVTRLEKNSFELTHHFYNGKNQKCATVKTVHVCVKREGFIKCKLPISLAQNLEKLLV